MALSRESALALRPPAWSPLRYFPPSARMATLLRSQNWKRNWTGVELLHTTAVSSPTHQYFPWESATSANHMMLSTQALQQEEQNALDFILTETLSTIDLYSILCVSRWQTFKGISSIVELQLENIIWCSVGVQSRHSGLTSPNEPVLPTEDNDWTVDEFHQELLSLRCAEGMNGIMRHAALVSQRNYVWYSNTERQKWCDAPNSVFTLFSLRVGEYFLALYLTCIINSSSELTILLSHHVFSISCTHAHSTVTPFQFK